MVVRVVYGTKLGLLRESPKTVTVDKFGRQTTFIDSFPILENSNYFQFMLTLKALIWVAFSLTTGSDLLFVQSELNCVNSNEQDCFILDNNYYEQPISNCTPIHESKDITAVCYKLALDYHAALVSMGGLLSFTRLELSVLAALNVRILMCLKQKKKYCTPLWISIQLVFCIIIVVISVSLYGAFANRGASPLRLAGKMLNFLGFTTTFFLSSLIPWYYIVNPNFCIASCTCT